MYLNAQNPNFRLNKSSNGFTFKPLYKIPKNCACNVSFGGIEYDEFKSKFDEVYPDSSMPDVLRNIAKSTEELNRGRNKKVYSIPGMSGYLIGWFYKKPQPDKTLPVYEYPDNFTKYNFGSPIAGNGYDLIVMKKLDGITAGCPIDMINQMHETGITPAETAKKYLSQMKLLKDFPQEAFDNLAEQAEYLVQNNIFFDFLNPNNLLIDTDKKELHIIDLFSEKTNQKLRECLKEAGNPKPGLYELLALLMDTRHLNSYLSQMNRDECREAVVISFQIIKKTIRAVSKTDLSLSDKSFEAVLNYFKKKYNEKDILWEYGKAWELIQDLSECVLSRNRADE